MVFSVLLRRQSHINPSVRADGASVQPGCVFRPRPCRWQIVCVNMLNLKVYCLFWEAQLECHQVPTFWFMQMALNFLRPRWSNVLSSWSWKQHLCERRNISCPLFGLNVALNPDWTLTVPEVVFGGAHINLMFMLSSLNHRHGSSKELLLELVMLAQGQSHLKCLWCLADTTKATRAKHVWTWLVFLMLT